jgi:hypothetical protein
MIASKLALHASCEKLLAVAAHSVLPTLIPVKGRAYEWGFEYDFLAKTPCEEGVLLLINEEMRRLVQANLPFELLNMMPANAAAFLQKNQPIQAKNASEYPASVVPLCKVKDFYDICPEELLATSREIQNFSLYEMLFLPEKIVRIRGVAFNEKKDLKNYLKQLERSKSNNPVLLGKELGLLSLVDEEAVWHPKGLEFKKYVENWLKESLLRRGFSESFSFSPRLGSKVGDKVFQETIRSSDETEGLFRVAHALSFVCYSRKNFEEDLISSLQFMKELATILQLESNFLLLQRVKSELLATALQSQGYPFEICRSDATQIELHAHDLRGRSWPISKLAILQEQEPVVECVPVLSYERLAALLLERDGSLLYGGKTNT